MTLRERQAEAARALIKEAALGLFLEFGYVATTMDDIAERAGAARGTVYNQFHSKAALLIALIEDRVEAARTWAREHGAGRERMAELDDPKEILDNVIEVQATVGRIALPIVRVAYEASVVDGEVATLLELQEEHRYEQQQYLLGLLADKGFLRTDVPFDYLMRGAWLLASPRFAITAIQPPWDLETYSQWLRETLQGLLLPCE